MKETYKTFNMGLIGKMSDYQVEQAAKFQVETYFGQTNYHKDVHLKKLEKDGGWISFNEIFSNFPKIKRFHGYLRKEDLFEVLEVSDVVQVKRDLEDNQTMLIRKRPK